MRKKKLLVGIIVFTTILTSISVNASTSSEMTDIPSYEATIGNQGEEQIPVEERQSIPIPEESLLYENGEAEKVNTYAQGNDNQEQELTDQTEDTWNLVRAGGTWINEGGRWWYKHYDGSYTKNGWEEIGGLWYHFDASGWMEAEKWISDGGKWYYVDSSGVMAVEKWMQLGGKWYYFDNHGVMVIGWRKLGGKWYYFESNGAMVSNANRLLNGTSYYFDGNGVLYRTVLKGVQRVRQAKDNWCWAASSEMVGTYNVSTPLHQEDIVRYIKGGSPHNVGGTAIEMVRAINYVSENQKSATSYTDARSYDMYVDQIDSNAPMITRVKWDKGGGHAIVCAGYNTQDGSLYFIDPWGNTPNTSYNYKSMCTGMQLVTGYGHIYGTITAR